MSDVENMQARTDSKLRYAAVHLNELLECPTKGCGQDFERAHQESFLFHLFGVRDAFLQELNIYYDCGLGLSAVKTRTLQDKLNQKGVRSDELDEIDRLQKDNNSWLKHATELRNHGTHRANVPLALHIGGDLDRQMFLKHPKTGKPVEKRDYALVFGEWLSSMGKLVQKLRRSAEAHSP